MSLHPERFHTETDRALNVRNIQYGASSTSFSIQYGCSEGELPGYTDILLC